MTRVLILDACQRSALAVTRSLGKQNLFIVTADETPTSLAGSSKYSAGNSTYPPPTSKPDLFVRAIADLSEKWNIQLVIPMTELTSMLLLESRSSFPGIISLFPRLETVDSLADKISLMRFATSLDVPVPKSSFVDNPANDSIKLSELTYPVVFKPSKSWIKLNRKWQRRSVRYADDLVSATNILDTDPAFQSHPFMIQERVEGQGKGIFALYNHGKAVAFFAHHRLREKPPQGGVSVLSESIECDPELLKYAKTILDEAGWHGVAMVEFKGNDGETPYLMEVNTRFWGSLQLAVDCGVDFPWMLYQIVNNESVKMTESYKTGERLRWLLGDVDNLYLTLRDSRITTWKKMTAVLNFLSPSMHKTRHEVNRWSDPKPFWWELKQYVQNLLR
jgi:predicted ATP-grasp superfamily ATP-dependent carboligase